MGKIYIKNINDIDITRVDINNIVPKKNTTEVSKKGWYLLYNILKDKYNIELDKSLIKYNDNNKPYLLTNEVYFNISHSKDLIAVIIDSKECGIDIEFIDENRNVEKLIYKTFSSFERFKFYNSKDKNLYFYKQWTKKEAYYKTNGTGIIYSQLNKNINFKNIKTNIIYNGKDRYCVSKSI